MQPAAKSTGQRPGQRKIKLLWKAYFFAFAKETELAISGITFVVGICIAVAQLGANRVQTLTFKVW